MNSIVQKRIVSVLLIALGLFLLIPNHVYAKKTLNDAPGTLGTVVTPTGVPTESIQVQLGTIVKGLLSLVGTIFFVLMIYAGFRWMTARGEEDEITKAKNTIIAAVIGLAIVLAAYAITAFFTNRLLSQETTQNQSGLCVSLCSGLSQTACGAASNYCVFQNGLCTQLGGNNCASKSEGVCTTPCTWQP